MNAEYKVTKYAIPGSGGRFKLALVSDLHEHEASWLLSYLKEEAPDLILIAGDTLERSDHGQDPRCCEKKGILKNLEYSILRFFIKMIYATLPYTPAVGFRPRTQIDEPSLRYLPLQ